MSVFDLLILVAATAAGLAVTRSLPAYLGVVEDLKVLLRIETGPTGGSSGTGFSTEGVVFKGSGVPVSSRPSYWLGHLPYWCGPCLVSWTIATALLALRSNRANRGRAGRGPGRAAAWAVGLALIVQVERCLQARFANGPAWMSFREGYEDLNFHLWIALPRLGGFAIAAAWVALRVSGRWPGRPDGPERLGQLVGWAWIGMAVSAEVGVWLFALNR